jgi:hypothetical protein
LECKTSVMPLLWMRCATYSRSIAHEHLNLSELTFQHGVHVIFGPSYYFFPLNFTTNQTIRTKESWQPRFPMEICDRTFQLIEDHLTALNHTGPVGLSCDDTKLFSSLRLFWDKEKNSYFLVGGVNGPYRVADPDSVRQVISEGKIKKATKVNTPIICSTH